MGGMVTDTDYNWSDATRVRRRIAPTGTVSEFPFQYNLGGMTKKQYGYRSSGEGETFQHIEEDFVNTSKALGYEGNALPAWATAKSIDYLERIERATGPEPVHRGPGAPVNERRYDESHGSGLVVPYRYLSGQGAQTSWEGYHQLSFPMISPNTNARRIYTLPQAVGGRALPEYTQSVKDMALNESIALLQKSAPTTPAAGLAQFIGELKDFPQLFDIITGFRSGTLSGVGSQYLNYSFGWKPFIGDIQRTAQAVIDSEEILSQFVRDSGKLVRRSRTKTIDEGSSYGKITRANASSLINDGTSIFNGVYIKDWSGTHVTRWTTSVKAFATWEYFVADPDGFLGRVENYSQQAQKLLGAQLTISTIYELTPWSWLTDWFVDIGGLLAYQQQVADNSLVMRRGGTVLTSEVHSDFVVDNVVLSRPTPSWSGGLKPGVHSCTSSHLRQWRIPGASPFGLRTNWNSLSSGQLSILGALGLSRTRIR